MAAEISGTRRQNRKNVDTRIVARVSATIGPVLGVSLAVKGARPDHCPRAEVGSSKIVQFSAEWLRQRRNTGASAITRRAVVASGHVARIAQTAVFGFGVKPSPVPEPHSFQNPTSGIRINDSRAAPICPKTQSRAGNEAKRNKERLTVLMADLRATCQNSLTVFAAAAKGNAKIR